MTISSTSTKVTLSGNGSTTVFAYNFLVLAASELKVYVRTTATGAESLRAAGTGSTNYAITGVGAASGGNVTFVTAPTAAESVILIRETGLTQSTDYVENSAFQAEDHETALDRLTMISQEQQEELDRSFKVSRTTSITTPEFVDDAAARADKVLAFSADGNSIEAVTGRVNTVTASTITPTAGAAGSSTASFTAASGALALGLAQGSTGMAAGISLQYSTTTTDSDPGVGFFRGNNTSLNSCTILYIDDSDGTTDITAQVQSWDDSTNTVKGFITIHGNPNPASPYVVFRVTAIADATGYTKVTVAYVAGATSISNNAEVSLSFTRAGDVGDPDDVLTTRGDIIARDASAAARLAIGAANTVLKTDGTDPSWGTVSTAMIGADQITNAKIADDQIDSEHYVDGSIDTAHLADNAITLAKMAGLARGKIITGDASGDPQALALGGSGTVLTSDGTDAAWTAAAAGGKLIQYKLANVSGAVSTANTGNSATSLGDTTFTPTSDSNSLIILVTGGCTYSSNENGESQFFISYIPNGGSETAIFASAALGDETSNSRPKLGIAGMVAKTSPGAAEQTVRIRANGCDVHNNATTVGWNLQLLIVEIAA